MENMSLSSSWTRARCRLIKETEPNQSHARNGSLVDWDYEDHSHPVECSMGRINYWGNLMKKDKAWWTSECRYKVGKHGTAQMRLDLDVSCTDIVANVYFTTLGVTGRCRTAVRKLSRVRGKVILIDLTEKGAEKLNAPTTSLNPCCKCNEQEVKTYDKRCPRLRSSEHYHQ